MQIEKEKVIKIINEIAYRYTGGPAVTDYAVDILENAEDVELLPTGFYACKAQKMLLIGADNWEHYSEGGCSLVTNFDIYERLGFVPRDEDAKVLRYQGMALRQAYNMIEFILYHYHPNMRSYDYENLLDEIPQSRRR